MIIQLPSNVVFCPIQKLLPHPSRIKIYIIFVLNSHPFEYGEIKIDHALFFKIVFLDHTYQCQVHIDLAEKYHLKIENNRKIHISHLSGPQCNHCRRILIESDRSRILDFVSMAVNGGDVNGHLKIKSNRTFEPSQHRSYHSTVRK